MLQSVRRAWCRLRGCESARRRTREVITPEMENRMQGIIRKIDQLITVEERERNIIEQEFLPGSRRGARPR